MELLKWTGDIRHLIPMELIAALADLEVAQVSRESRAVPAASVPSQL